MLPRHRTILVALLAAASPLFAQKVDTLTFRNGDRVTGEIKRLSRGQLEYSTSPMGTVAAKWTHVTRIESPRFFELTARSGVQYYGALRAAPDTGRVIIHVAQFADTVPLDSIVDIVPIGQGFISRVNGYLDLGFTFAKANRNTQFTFGAEASYRTRGLLARLTVQSYYQSQESASATRRHNATLFGQRYLSGNWGVGGTTGLETNEELGLDLRATLAAAGGLALLRSTEALVAFYGGLAATSEAYAGAATSTESLEGLFAADANVYHFGDRKLDVSARAQAFPSITDWGRVRLQVDARASYEVLRDFTVGLTLYDDFDSRPPGGAASDNDYGTSLTIGWTF
jgi:hypothetical protein